MAATFSCLQHGLQLSSPRFLEDKCCSAAGPSSRSSCAGVDGYRWGYSTVRKPAFANTALGKGVRLSRNSLLWGIAPSRTGVCRALADSNSERERDAAAIEEARKKLSSMMEQPGITGKELRELVFQKYGRSYDVRLCKFNRKVYLQIMWRFLEQRSFHMTEEQYQAQLDAVAELVTEWGSADMLRAAITSTRQRPGMTGGGGAKAVSIPLNVARGDGRGKEWLDCF